MSVLGHGIHDADGIKEFRLLTIFLSRHERHHVLTMRLIQGMLDARGKSSPWFLVDMIDNHSFTMHHESKIGKLRSNCTIFWERV